MTHAVLPAWLVRDAAGRTMEKLTRRGGSISFALKQATKQRLLALAGMANTALMVAGAESTVVVNVMLDDFALFTSACAEVIAESRGKGDRPPPLPPTPHLTSSDDGATPLPVGTKPR